MANLGREPLSYALGRGVGAGMGQGINMAMRLKLQKEKTRIDNTYASMNIMMKLIGQTEDLSTKAERTNELFRQMSMTLPEDQRETFLADMTTDVHSVERVEKQVAELDKMIIDYGNGKGSQNEIQSAIGQLQKVEGIAKQMESGPAQQNVAAAEKKRKQAEGVEALLGQVDPSKRKALKASYAALGEGAIPAIASEALPEEEDIRIQSAREKLPPGIEVTGWKRDDVTGDSLYEINGQWNVMPTLDKHFTIQKYGERPVDLTGATGSRGATPFNPFGGERSSREFSLTGQRPPVDVSTTGLLPKIPKKPTVDTSGITIDQKRASVERYIDQYEGRR